MTRVHIWLVVVLASAFSIRGFRTSTTSRHPQRSPVSPHISKSKATEDDSKGDTNLLDAPFCWHPIDYSAANEFIQEHYRHVFGEDPYFADSGPFDEDNHDQGKPIEPIFNGRNGIHDDNNLWRPADLKKDGFQLVQAPSRVTDWTDLPQIKEVYLTELEERILPSLVDTNALSHVIFWNPVLRGENQTISNVERNYEGPQPPTSPTAGMVHIDTDVGAYDTRQLVGMIQKNWIAVSEDDGLDWQEMVDAIEKGHRFAIVNFWRNADRRNPVRRQPLAVFAPHYNDVDNAFFPRSKPHPTKSKWYTFPNMTANEVLVFKQYDRDGSHPSDVWHCALKSIQDEAASLRVSFDVRAFLVYKDKVPDNQDRYGSGRIRPVLSYEESGAFCNQQAAKRGLHTS